MVRQAINPGLVISGIVLCMHEKQTVLANEVVSDLNQFLEDARGSDSPWNHTVVYDPPIRRNIKLAECPSFGQSVFTYAPDSNGASDYHRLAREYCQKLWIGSMIRRRLSFRL
jgi:chromosome partitioning protein